jgi:hypothetical protein
MEEFLSWNPFCIVLNWNVNGISVSSLVSKKTSHLVKNTPVHHQLRKIVLEDHTNQLFLVFVFETIVLLTTCVPVVLANCSSSNVCLFSTLAFLTEIIFS